MTPALIALYLLAVGLLDWLAYKRYHHRWRRRERARITVGVSLVLFPALVLALVGVLDALTWLTIFAGFGLAGAMTLYLDIQGETGEAQRIREGFQNDQSHE